MWKLSKNSLFKLNVRHHATFIIQLKKPSWITTRKNTSLEQINISVDYKHLQSNKYFLVDIYKIKQNF